MCLPKTSTDKNDGGCRFNIFFCITEDAPEHLVVDDAMVPTYDRKDLVLRLILAKCLVVESLGK